MPTEPAIDLIATTLRACIAHRRTHQLPPAHLGGCNATDCPLHAGCPVLARQGAAFADLIENTLQAGDAVQQALRERSMIYQADLKDTVAAHYHLDRQALYELPYADWAVLRQRYISERTAETAAIVADRRFTSPIGYVCKDCGWPLRYDDPVCPYCEREEAPDAHC